MNVTSTAVAVTLAVVIAMGFLLFGPGLFAPFTAQSQTQTQAQQPNPDTTMSTSTDAAASPVSGLPSGLQAFDEVVGSGAEAKAGEQVTVNYVGALTDGTVFDASANHGQPFSFVLGQGNVIKGWDLGVAGMKEGGKRRLVISSALAYGDQGVPNVIPPGATLIFDVELVKVGQ